MVFSEFLKSVVKIKNLPLLGEDSQFKMVPPFRQELLRKQGDNIKQAKKAAVMALFYPDANNVTYLVLILRKTYKGVHSAQVGFPGGKLEADETLQEAALRETEEEVGIAQKTITVLKALSEVYIPPSNFYVYPFIGVANIPLQFIKQDDEVEAVIEVPLSEFLDDKNLVTKTVKASYQAEIEVPAFKLQGHIVWGATAMMLSEIKDMLLECFGD